MSVQKHTLPMIFQKIDTEGVVVLPVDKAANVFQLGRK